MRYILKGVPRERPFKNFMIRHKYLVMWSHHLWQQISCFTMWTTFIEYADIFPLFSLFSYIPTECPPAMDGMERFACPTPDRQGRYRCIDDHVLCDGFIDCPEGEDEERQACMFYKTVSDDQLSWSQWSHYSKDRFTYHIHTANECAFFQSVCLFKKQVSILINIGFSSFRQRRT